MKPISPESATSLPKVPTLQDPDIAVDIGNRRMTIKQKKSHLSLKADETTLTFAQVKLLASQILQHEFEVETQGRQQAVVKDGAQGVGSVRVQ